MQRAVRYACSPKLTEGVTIGTFQDQGISEHDAYEVEVASVAAAIKYVCPERADNGVKLQAGLAAQEALNE